MPGQGPPPWQVFADAVLQRQGLLTRLGRGVPPQHLAGWFIADDETDHLLRTLPGLQAVTPEPVPGSDALDHAIATAAATLHEAVRTGDAPFDRLARRAHLNEPEWQLLAVAAAVELNPQRQRLVGYLQDDTSAAPLRLATLDGLTSAGTVPVAPGGRLTAMRLVDVSPDGPWARRVVSLPSRVAWHLLGDDSPDPDLPPGTQIIDSGTHDRQPGLPPALLLVHGADRQSRLLQVAEIRCGPDLLVAPVPSTEVQWRALVREAVLRDLPVVLETDRLDPGGCDWLQRTPFLTWALSSAAELPVETLPRRSWTEIAVRDGRPHPREWVRALGAPPTGEFLLDREQLRLAAAVAPRSAPVSVTARVRRIAAGHLDRLARRTIPSRGWDDLVLPADQTAQLHELADRHRGRATVYDDWGFPGLPSTGVVALFGGPSGTGKTLAAEVIAGDLGLDLYSIDLSGVVSKYIGETEKNLGQLFDAAMAADLVLFFDEADALFSKRSEVSDAHDRYANIEVSYLLQRLERYDGVVVLATNLQRNIDQAFVRRLTCAVDFALPDVPQRRAIWTRCLPATAPTRDLDLDLLAENFRVSGGMIRNAALGAAFRAAAGDGVITMEHLVLALRREFQKAGRLRTPEEFGPYYHLVTGDGDVAAAR